MLDYWTELTVIMISDPVNARDLRQFTNTRRPINTITPPRWFIPSSDRNWSDVDHNSIGQSQCNNLSQWSRYWTKCTQLPWSGTRVAHVTIFWQWHTSLTSIWGINESECNGAAYYFISNRRPKAFSQINTTESLHVRYKYLIKEVDHTAQEQISAIARVNAGLLNWINSHHDQWPG